MRAVKKAVRKSTQLIFAFMIGQGVQLMFHALFFNWWEQYQIPLCASAGVIITAAVVVGVRISAREVVTRYEDMQ